MSPTWSAADRRWMRRALALAEAAAGYTNPNPAVGAVVVQDEDAAGEGQTQPYGGPHAEWLALEAAGPRARGGTLYVSWEPCVAHPGKRTPPCVERILAAGVRRVVVAAPDPHPQVCGRGIAALEAGGVGVDVGLLQKDAETLNEISRVYHTTGRPFVCLKWAMSLDGKIAAAGGDARWISGKAARAHAHGLRHRHAAVLVGVKTALQDDPALNVRHVPGRDPWRVVLDSAGRLPPTARMLRLGSDAPTVVAATGRIPAARERALSAAGATVWRLPAVAGRVSLPALLEALAREGLDSVLVEGGGETLWAFASAGLFDKAVCYVAPKLVGGRSAPSPLGGAGVSEIAAALQLERLSAKMLRHDVLLTGYRAGEPADSSQEGA